MTMNKMRLSVMAIGAVIAPRSFALRVAVASLVCLIAGGIVLAITVTATHD